VPTGHRESVICFRSRPAIAVSDLRLHVESVAVQSNRTQCLATRLFWRCQCEVAISTEFQYGFVVGRWQRAVYVLRDALPHCLTSG
jgi:hypothetical protein